MKGKANWMKNLGSLLLCAALLLQCGVFAMPSALAEEGETPVETSLCETCGNDPCTCETADDSTEDEPTGQVDETYYCPDPEVNGHSTTCIYYVCPDCEYTLVEDGTVVHAEGCNADYVYDGTDDLEKYVQLSDMAIEYGIDVSGDPANEDSMLFFYDEFGENTVMQITGWYWDPDTSGLWYYVDLYSGAFPVSTEDYTWPETPWILQTYTNDIEAFGYSLDFVEIGQPDEPENPCDCCEDCTGDSTCTCECEGCTCVEQEPDEPEKPCGCCDDCTGDENCTCECEGCTCVEQEPDEPENCCGCCEDCTGDENCTCECEGCTCVEQEPDEPEIPSVEAPVTDIEGNELTDREGNPITITVSGEALPDGAQVVATVPTVNSELLEDVYDIKVLVDGVEWQPIDEGKTVTVTIPVDTDRECTGVLHFIDYADAIDGDEVIISTEGVDTAELMPLLSAIDAYGDGSNVAVEVIPGQLDGNMVSFETSSFSIYWPDYSSAETEGDENFTVNFTSSSSEDPSNEKTYYITADEKLIFAFTYEFGGILDFDVAVKQNGSYSLTRLSDSSDIEISTTRTIVSGNNWSGGIMQESTTVDFSAIDVEIGELFEIRWESGLGSLGKNDRWTRVMIVGEFDITFNANGGEFSDSSNKLIQKVVSYQPVSMVEQPTKDGYIFGGWSAVPNAVVGDVVYSLTDNFPVTLPADTIFYAQWEPMQYTVTYVVPENSTNKDLFVSQTKNYGIDLTLNPTKPLVDNDTVFQCWIGSDGDTYDPGDTYTGNEDLTLVGLWDDAVYTLMYNANGGTGAPTPQYLDTSETDSRVLTIVSQTPTRPGYSFVEWKDKDGNTYAPGDPITLSSSVTLYAQWSIIPYIIVFHANGGSGSMEPMTNLYYEDNFSDTSGRIYANLTANTFVMTSHTFEGWSLTDGNNDVVYTNGQNIKVGGLVDAAVKAGQTGSTITLYAVWAEGTYKIIYEPGTSTNDVTITNPSQTVIINKAGTTTINSSAQRTGYTFAGWADKDGNIYMYGDLVPLSTTNNDEITLTATWTIEVAGYIYTLVDGSYALGGTITVDGESYTGTYVKSNIAEDETVSAMTFTPIEGYEISRIVVDGIEQTVEDTSSYYHPPQENVSASSVVVVVTVPKTYTVTFIDHDGTVIDTQTVSHGSAAVAPTNPTREDYTFTGWDKDFSNVTSDLTVTAQYEQDTIVSVTITWSDLTFTYTPGDWDPQTHTYADGSFSPENATITVENSGDSTVIVNAAISYEANKGYEDIEAQFSIGADGEKLGTAEKDGITPGSTVVFYLWLSGRVDDLSQGEFISGTCTVTIEADSG